MFDFVTALLLNIGESHKIKGVQKMKRCFTLILVFVLLATLGVVYADVDNQNSNKVVEFQVIDNSELPEGVIPYHVPEGVSLEEALQGLRTGVLGYQAIVPETVESLAIIPRSQDTDSENLMVYCDCGLYNHNAYSTVTYDVL